MTVTELLASIAFLTMAAPAPVSGGSAIAQPADFKAQADALVRAAYPADGPGAAVIVTRGGRVVYAAGQGLADLEAKRAITPDTPFRLGSIVKQFTAATVLKLVEEGKLSLDDPVSRFLPDWPEPGAKATVRQLLNHSSGIQDFSKIPGWIARNRHRPLTTAELLAVSRDLPARARPGEAWEYNNGGYVLLGAIIEKVTGTSWHEAMAERITRPLGLKTIAHAEVAATAKGYTDADGHPQPVQLSRLNVAHAAGGLVGSVSDMARWADALHGGRVVKPASYREMTQPARLADGSTQPYGFGLRLQALRGRPTLVHGGSGGGLDTDSVYLPSEDLFVAVFANSDDPATDPSSLTRRLAALSLGEPIPSFTRAAPDIAQLEPLFGSYSAENGPARRFSARDGKLYFGRGDEEREVFAAGDDRFFFGPDALAWFRIVRQPGGAHQMELHDPESTAPARAIRTGPVPPPLAVAPAVLRSYAGTFKTETVTLTVALGETGRLTMAAPGQAPMMLRPVSQTEFHVEGAPMRVVFHPENGSVERLTIHRGARELHGTRIPG